MSIINAAIALLALGLLAPLASAAPAAAKTSSPDGTPAFTTADALQQVFLDQAEVDRATALIRSQAGLKRYLAITPEAPLNRLPAGIKHSFIKRLTFTQAGLGSYSYAGLADHLSIAEIYQTLSLFGVQKSIGAIPGLRARNETDRKIATLSFENCDQMGPEGNPTCPAKTKTDHVCADDWLGDGYKCHYSFGDVCTSSCGK